MRVLVEYLTLHPNAVSQPLHCAPENTHVCFGVSCSVFMQFTRLSGQFRRNFPTWCPWAFCEHAWRTRDDLFRCVHRFTAQEVWARHPCYCTMPHEALHRVTQLTVDLGVAIHRIQPWALWVPNWVAVMLTWALVHRQGWAVWKLILWLGWRGSSK